MTLSHGIVAVVMMVICATSFAEPTSEDAAKMVAVLHLKKGDAYRARGKLADAEREYDLAILSYPDGANLYSVRGQTRYGQKNYQGAIEDFDVYLAKAPSDTNILFLRGLAKSLLKPEDVAGACDVILKYRQLGGSLKGIEGLDKYCHGRPGWNEKSG